MLLVLQSLSAGILAASQRWTSDGYDHMIASNYLGPFMLTQQLLPLLEKSAPHARIVNVVSFTHRCVRSLQIEKDQLVKGTLQIPLSRSYYALAQIYETSKLCLLLFSYELHRRYSCKKSASRISVMYVVYFRGPLDFLLPFSCSGVLVRCSSNFFPATTWYMFTIPIYTLSFMCGF